ncbi:MAG: PQQ-binding-like beta-propeller repeat protein [Candidatus Omnitrophota bacterium]
MFLRNFLFKMFYVLVAAGLFGIPLGEGLRCEDERLAPLPGLKDHDTVLLERYATDTNVWEYFALSEQLNILPAEELIAFRQRLEGVRAVAHLKKLAEKVIIWKKQEDGFILVEDNGINTAPSLDERPFNGTGRGDFYITSLKPEAEYLYFPNLKLPYTRYDLTRKTRQLWVGQKSAWGQGDDVPSFGHFPVLATARLAPVKQWVFELREDHTNDFLFTLRQWLKSYEENPLFPVCFGNVALMRNEHRLFCFDLSSGKEIWSIGDVNKTREEFFQTLRQPHHNSVGYELSVSSERCYTELNGTLMAIDLSDVIAPKILWKRELGEYTVFMKPLVSKDILAVGLINTRREIWICGFDVKTGELQWSTYIGLTSSLSPVCTISAERNGRLFFATNTGLLMALDSLKGGIAWVRTYAVRKYSIYHFWKNKVYKKRLQGRGFLRYDTQFMELNDGTLYCKPRESDYLYIINAETGDLNKSFKIDPSLYYLLKIYDRKAVFLRKEKPDDEHADPAGPRKAQGWLRIVDLDSGRQLYEQYLGYGALQGVQSRNDNELFFKVAGNIHFLRFDKEHIVHHQAKSPGSGWLVGCHGPFLFLGDGKSLMGATIMNEKEAVDPGPARIRDLIAKKERIVKVFHDALSMKSDDEKASGMREWLLTQAREQDFPVKQFMEKAAGQIKNIDRILWKPLFDLLRERFGDEIVEYQGISIKLSCFLEKAELAGQRLPQSMSSGPLTLPVSGQKVTPFERKSYEVRGESLSLLPFQVIRGAKAPDFYLMLNYDQLFCIAENGMIKWARKVFNLSPFKELAYFVRPRFDARQGRMDADDIRAYLFDDVLILNCHGNMLAFQAEDGAYRWSVTNPDEKFNAEKYLPPDNPDKLYKKFGVSRSYLKGIAFQTEFLDDRLIVTHGNRIFSLDPLTGYCYQKSVMGIEAAIRLIVSEGYIYVLSSQLDKFAVYDRELSLKRSFNLNFIKNKDEYPEVFVLKDAIIIRQETNILSFNKQTGVLKSSVLVEARSRMYGQLAGGSFVLVEPFRKIFVYSAEGGIIRETRRINIGSSGGGLYWRGLPERSSNYYTIIGPRIMTLKKTGCDFFLVCFDLVTGEKVWERMLPGVRGQLYYVSVYGKSDTEVALVTATACFENCPSDISECDKATVVATDSKIITLNTGTGSVMSSVSLPGNVADSELIYINGFEGSSFFQTQDYFLYTIQGNKLKAEGKNNGHF